MNCLKYLCIIFLFTITAYVYCQDSTTDDIDSLFEEAEAIEPPVKTEPEEDSTSDNIDSLFEEAEDIKIPPGQKEPKKEIDSWQVILQAMSIYHGNLIKLMIQVL
jgi:hypothetical protein